MDTVSIIESLPIWKSLEPFDISKFDEYKYHNLTVFWRYYFFIFTPSKDLIYIHFKDIKKNVENQNKPNVSSIL